MHSIPKWSRFEAQFISCSEYSNPVQENGLEADFVSPSGKKVTVSGFWDGGNTWKVRFSPDETGEWTYRTRCSTSPDSGLENQTGRFRCVPYQGDNPLLRHGSVRVSANQRYLTHDDGVPFFFLADTAWNGPLLSTEADWETFLTDRRDKGFNVIQFVPTQWIASAGNAEGRQACYGRERIVMDPVFFRRLDERIDAINAHGMAAAPVLIWAATWNGDALNLNPGTFLPDDQIVLLAKYFVARYGSHHVFWFLAGDGDYRGDLAGRWKRIGREVFGIGQKRLASTHPGGLMGCGDEFRSEPWFDFIGYQSGHSSKMEDLRWLIQGPPALDWKKEPVKPFINIEPNYEAHCDWNVSLPFSDREVRRAAYWSLLIHPPAGVTYGAHGIWSWETKPAIPMNHTGTGIALPWFEAMRLPGSACMKILKDFFTSLEWWKLQPAPELLAVQPGETDPALHIAVAKASDDSFFLAYIPTGGRIELKPEGVSGFKARFWYNPRTGARIDGVKPDGNRFLSPDDSDWLLYINRLTN